MMPHPFQHSYANVVASHRCLSEEAWTLKNRDTDGIRVVKWVVEEGRKT